MSRKTSTKDTKSTKPTNGKPQPGPGRIRGLTRAQYLALSRMVAKGETSWEELERRGLAYPPRRESEFTRQARHVLKN